MYDLLVSGGLVYDGTGADPCVLMWQWPAAGLPPSVTLLEPRRK